jgi:hypothetical protein
MRQSIINLRAAKSAYDTARQKRYDELATWDMYDGDALEQHTAAVKRISLEERAPTGIIMDSGMKIMSVDAYIHDDKLYVVTYDGTEDKFMFDLS